MGEFRKDADVRQKKRDWSSRKAVAVSTAVRLAILLSLFGPLFGCNTFGNAKLVQELRLENERLLTEYRAEKNRREVSEEAVKVMEARLAESEKLLARQYQSPSSRLSSLPAATNSFEANRPNSGAGFGEAAPLEDQESGLKWQRRASSN